MEEKVNIEMIEGFKPRHRLFGRHGKGYNKSLDLVSEPTTGRMWFVVIDHGTEIIAGHYLQDAIDIYNEI